MDSEVANVEFIVKMNSTYSCECLYKHELSQTIVKMNSKGARCLGRSYPTGSYRIRKIPTVLCWELLDFAGKNSDGSRRMLESVKGSGSGSDSEVFRHPTTSHWNSVPRSPVSSDKFLSDSMGFGCVSDRIR